MAKTMLNYNPIEPYMVSFRANTLVRVLSKAAGSNPNLWGIDVQGRRGYAPISHLQESEVIVRKDALIEVPTEPFMEVPAPKEPSAEVQPTIDGTTVEEDIISSERNDNIATASTETQEQQKRIDDNISDSLNEISGQEDLSEQQQLQPQEEVVQKIVPETANHISEPVEMQNEIRENDDEEDEGFEDEWKEENDEGNYAGREPVTEPPFIKKHAYQTGEKDVENLQNADVKLELIGSDAKRPEENNLIENNTVSALGSGVMEVDEPVNVYAEENAPEINSDSNENDIKNESQQEKTAEKLPLVDTGISTAAVSSERVNVMAEENAPEVKRDSSETKHTEIRNEEAETKTTVEAASLSETKHTEIRNEEAEPNTTNDTPQVNIVPNIETNGTIPSGSTDEVEKNNEILKPTENESVPVAASEASAAPPSFKDEQSASEAIPADEASPRVQPNQIDSNVDDFHRHIENVLEKVQDPFSQQASTFNPSNLGDETNGVNSISPDSPSVDSSGENHFKNPFGLNTEDNGKDNPEIPINTAVDPVQNIESTEIPNVVEEKSTPIAEEKAIVPEIADEVLPLPDKIIAEVLPTTSPSPILDEGLSEDIFTSRPPRIEVEYQNVESVETGNWYDGIVEIAFEGYSSVLRLFDSDASEKNDVIGSQQNAQADVDALEDGYCEKLDDGSCPKKSPKSVHTHDHVFGAAIHHMKNVNYDDFAKEFLVKVIAMADLVILLTFAAIAVLIFILGQYYLEKTQKESALISKLNIIEKKLLVSEKECSIVKGDLIQTRKQLVSIEDSSFGSNDMVIALKQQLEHVENEKLKLQQQITTLEKVSDTSRPSGCNIDSNCLFFAGIGSGRRGWSRDEYNDYGTFE